MVKHTKLLSRRNVLQGVAGSGLGGSFGISGLEKSGVSWSKKPDSNGRYKFDGFITKSTLETYLSRAVTHAGLLAANEVDAGENFEENLRMLKNVGAKFVGRAAFLWASGYSETFWEQVDERITAAHKALGDEVIFQACLFETVPESVTGISIPDWVFKEFDLEPQNRTFDYEAMLYDDGSYKDHWGEGLSVPDMSLRETKMWFYYRAVRYIDAGIEAIHFGQVYLMDINDPDYEHWYDIVGRIREYAGENARRNKVLTDSHTSGIKKNGELLHDFHSFPCRIQEKTTEDDNSVLEGELVENESIFGESIGGKTPSGWTAKSLPYLVEIDNYGVSPTPGESTPGNVFIWGWDEITWFANQPEEYRNEWLSYAHNWVTEHAPYGHFQMPLNRILTPPVEINYEGVTYISTRYSANTQSDAIPEGFNQEESIAEIWSSGASG